MIDNAQTPHFTEIPSERAEKNARERETETVAKTHSRAVDPRRKSRAFFHSSTSSVDKGKCGSAVHSRGCGVVVVVGRCSGGCSVVFPSMP